MRNRGILTYSIMAGIASLILTGTALPDDHPRLVVQTGHIQDKFNFLSFQYGSVATFSPDERLVITHYADGTYLWDAATGNEIRRIGQQSDVADVSPMDGNILTVGVDKEPGSQDFILWNPSTGEEIRRLEEVSNSQLDRVNPIDPPTSAIVSVAFSPDGRRIVGGESNGSIRFWDAATGRQISRLNEHSLPVRLVVFSKRDGDRLLTADDSGAVLVWNTSSGKVIQRFVGHSESVRAGVFCCDDKFIVTGGCGAAGCEEADPEWVTIGTGGTMIDIDGAPDYTVRLWDVATGKEQWRFRSASPVNAVAVSPDDRFVFVGSSNDDLVRVLDRGTGKERKDLESDVGPTGGTLSVRLSRDGRVLTADRDGVARMWQFKGNQGLIRFGGGAAGVERIHVTPDGNRILALDSDGTAVVWDTEAGALAGRFPCNGYASPMQIAVQSFRCALALSNDGQLLFDQDRSDNSYILDISTGKQICEIPARKGLIMSAAFSQDDATLLTGLPDGEVRLWNAKTGEPIYAFNAHDRVFDVAFSPKGDLLATNACDWFGRHRITLWEARTGRFRRQISIGALKNYDYDTDSIPLGSSPGVVSSISTMRLTFTPDGGKLIVCGEAGAAAIDIGSGIPGSSGTAPRIYPQATANAADFNDLLAITLDGTAVLTAGYNCEAELRHSSSGKISNRMRGHVGPVTSGGFLDGRLPNNGDKSLFELTGSADGTIRLWDATGTERCELISFRDGTWLVVDPQGRFDTNNLEEINGARWVMPDDPLKPLPVEIFMRDYYEPRLLPKILNGEALTSGTSGSIGNLNRVQPTVAVLSVKQAGAPDVVAVRVEVASVTGEQGGKTVGSGVYDLRLFRDGQLVGQWPDPKTVSQSNLPGNPDDNIEDWRRATKVELDPATGEATRTFAVTLPRRAGLKQVEFSAYAFNEDRVKSATARQTFDIPNELTPIKGRAYIVAFGVSAFENPSWNKGCEAAANDAREMEKVLPEALSHEGDYADVVPIQLIYDRNENRATKRNFKTVLRLLAGEAVDAGELKNIPYAERIRKARPEDLVLLFFATHGLSRNSHFYLLPHDIGADNSRQSPDRTDLLQHCISSDELSLWLKDVDAGDMAMIIDACHSQASVEAGPFKGGPMGCRGLGQLAYDKGMRILAATSKAYESANQGDRENGVGGYLTWALVHDGLEDRKAAEDGIITLKGWLEYGKESVPALHKALAAATPTHTPLIAKNQAARGLRGDFEGDEKSAFQQPSLFDFVRGPNKRDIVILRCSQ